MLKKEFLKMIQPVATSDLIRLGRNSDGGYVVNKSAVEGASLVSFGVNDDWSFEEAFAASSTGTITMFDGSVSALRFKHDYINALMEPWSLKFGYGLLRIKRFISGYFKKLRNTYRIYTGFCNFTRRQNISFFKYFISNVTSTNTLSFSDVLSKLPQKDSLFLKIDIEGHEYRILNDVAKVSERITGMVIEFHDLDIMFPLFSKSLEILKEDFYITHAHANNYNDVHPVLGVPAVWEITFINKTLVAGEIKPAIGYYPCNLDFPNDLSRKDYEFSFEN